jgi:hypothetical protein
MTTKVTAALAALLCAALVAGCGGGGSATDTGASAGVGASAGNAASPRAAFKCMNDAGLNVRSTPPNGPNIVSAVAVNSGKSDQVLVWFMKTPKAASSYAKAAGAFLAKAAGGGATADVFASTIVVGRGPDATDDQVNSVEDCLTS